MEPEFSEGAVDHECERFCHVPEAAEGVKQIISEVRRLERTPDDLQYVHDAHEISRGPLDQEVPLMPRTPMSLQIGLKRLRGVRRVDPSAMEGPTAPDSSDELLTIAK